MHFTRKQIDWCMFFFLFFFVPMLNLFHGVYVCVYGICICIASVHLSRLLLLAVYLFPYLISRIFIAQSAERRRKREREKKMTCCSCWVRLQIVLLAIVMCYSLQSRDSRDADGDGDGQIVYLRSACQTVYRISHFACATLFAKWGNWLLAVSRRVCESIGV